MKQERTSIRLWEYLYEKPEEPKEKRFYIIEIYR